MLTLNLIQATAAILSGLFLFLGIRSLGIGHFVVGAVQGSVSLLFFSLFGFFFLMTSHLYTYEHLTKEQAVATVSFEKLVGRLYRATAAFSDGRDEQFLIHGDEWQLDARILKWHGVAQLMGMDNLFRLERLSGRYSDIEMERSARRSVYALGKKAGWQIDLWNLAKDHKSWIPWVDAAYGSAAYMPMEDNSIYRVTLGQSGLIARRMK